MSLKTFLFPSYEDEGPVYSIVLLIARIFFGLLFLTHGYDKLMAHSTMAPFYPDPIGVGSFLSFWLTVFAEVVCSFALIFGLLQRIVLIPMIITMCVAFFVVHGGDAFAVKELSFIYLVVFVGLYITGPGKYSFDSTIGNYMILNELKKRDEFTHNS